MLGNLWTNSSSMAEKLGIHEITLSSLREKGIFKPGIHWKSDPNGQKKPWNPVPVYNEQACEKFIKSKMANNFDIYAA
tara:strand:- start:271 stop:504 length:234 start_codon:yes stop_codon:yes gene_type:complete